MQVSVQPLLEIHRMLHSFLGAIETLSIMEPEQRLEATLNNLLPFTNYSITLSASTSAGTGIGSVNILTTEETGRIYQCIYR